MPFRSHRGDEFSRQILVQQDFHAGCSSFWCASSTSAPPTDSSVRLGYASTISATDRPAASDSKMSATEMRVPRTRGLPPKCSKSETIQFFKVKDSYWRWPERNLAGNAIDFHVQVLGLSFHDAMRQITGT